MPHPRNRETQAELSDASNAIETLDVVPAATPVAVRALVDLLADRLAGGARPILPTAHPETMRALARSGPPPPPETMLIVATSGSTGTPKLTCLTRAALIASISATARRLGGHGDWLLPLPATHIAGVQVVLRAIYGGGALEILDQSTAFTPARFGEATARLPQGSGRRRYTSLVPTQLRRILEPATDAVAALKSYDAVLVGGAHLDARLALRARRLGIKVVTTYGMSETAGGCVYDGTPLDGVELDLVDVNPDTGVGRIRIAGPTLASGYLRGEPGFEGGAKRWFVTSDLGRISGQGDVLEVIGRADDIIISGGAKLSPAAVEAAARGVPGITDAMAVGLPDAEWGQRLVLVVTTADAASPLSPMPHQLADVLRTAIRSTQGREATPSALYLTGTLPTMASGKPDRRAMTDQVSALLIQPGE